MTNNPNDGGLPPDTKETRMQFSDPKRSRIMAVSLIMLTTIVSIFAIIFLAATLSQSRLSTIAVDGVNIGLWKLSVVQERWQAARNEVKERRDELINFERTFPDIKYRTSTALNDLNRLNTLINAQAQIIAIDLEPTKQSKLVQDLLLLSSPAAIVQRVTQEENISADNAKLDNLKKMYFDYLEKQRAVAALEQDFNNATEQRSALSAEVKNAQERVQSELLLGRPSLDPASSARIENALYELTPYNDFGRFYKLFTTMQPDILTLGLVVLMGVLGSSLQVANSYFRFGGDTSDGSYFLRLGVGAVTALVIFVLAKAGVVIVADTSKLAGEAPINPYFISFIAIISGLMSERAIVAVQKQGERFFANSDTGITRWARFDLRPGLTGDLSADQLAKYLNVSKNDSDGILAGTEPATPAQQHTIATYFRQEIRDLFSDIQPKAPLE